MITKKIMLGVAAIATATALVFGASSFDKKPMPEPSLRNNHKSLTTAYFLFTGNSMADYYDSTKWVVSNTPPDGCNDNVNTCSVQSETLQSRQDIAEFLENGGTPNQLDPNSDHSTDYKIIGKREAFQQ